MAVPLQAPYAQFFDSNGDPLSGGKVYTYYAGTTTPKATYTDAGGLTPAANPIILDSSGRAAIWIVGTYRIDVYTSADVLVRSTDEVPAYSAGGDMTKAVYDPANIAQQLVGTTAVQTITNKSLAAGDSLVGLLSQRVVQVIYASTSAVATGTTVMPCDDTIPQITEGNEYLTAAITPTSATNKLLIEVRLLLSTSVAGGLMACALFQDATAGSLAAILQYMATSDRPLMFSFSYEMTAGTTSSTTFRVRAGHESAGTTTLNGLAGARKLGGVAASTLTITEIKV